MNHLRPGAIATPRRPGKTSDSTTTGGSWVGVPPVGISHDKPSISIKGYPHDLGNHQKFYQGNCYLILILPVALSEHWVEICFDIRFAKAVMISIFTDTDMILPMVGFPHG